MKNQPELQKALRLIARRGNLRIAAEVIGVSHPTVKRWSSVGLPASKAALVWNATGQKVDLAKLVMEGK